ncbi:MAG: hypothetical protein FJ045_02180, partial [Crenarchaeota archaeon]|nr:hypothetical protein [Thermoproteota archaeon]
MSKNKTVIAIAKFLMFAMAISLVALPAATAQKYDRTKTTHAFVGAVPNPAGVGQEVLLHVGITDDLGVVADGWKGLSVTITRPDG